MSAGKTLTVRIIKDVLTIQIGIAALAEAIAKAEGAVLKLDCYALDTADLDRTRVHLANCIMNCGTRIYEGDKHHVTPNDEFYCVECAKAEGRS